MPKDSLPNWIKGLIALVPILGLIWGMVTWSVTRSDKKAEDREGRLNKRFDIIEKKIDNLQSADTSKNTRLIKLEVLVDVINRDLATNETRVFVVRRGLAKLDSIGRTK